MLEERLAEKGWSKRDISKTVRIIRKAKKHPKIRVLDESVYWFSLLLAIIGNFIISVSLIPVLLVLQSFPLYLVLITIGVAFGLLFELLIRTIEHLEVQEHLFLGIIVPAIAVFNVFIIVVFSNSLEEVIKIDNPQNPLMIGVVYAGAFILPYAFYQLFLKKLSQKI